MSDFSIPPYALFRDRRSILSDLGLGTILGDASPLPPQWDYFRRRAAEYDDASRRGVAPNVEPPPDSPEYQSALPQAFGNSGATSPPGPAGQIASIAIPVGGGLGASTAGQTFAGLGARLAPAASGLAAGGAMLLTPTNTPATTYDLGDGLRAQSAPGQRSVSIERRVDNGLLGTGVGAKWERLPVEAEVGPGPDGIVGLKINPDQLKAAVGDEAANRVLGNAGGKNDLPPPPISLPSKIEMRIGVLINGSAETEKREATREEVLSVCPNYPTYERIGLEAAEKYKAAGMENGLAYGQRVHRSLETTLRMHDIQSSLHERGIFELNPELALLNGVDRSYSKGSSRLDVVELHNDHVTVCVYELKTGGARIRDETMDRYLREASLYAKSRSFGYPNVYFLPIRVP
jgi:hypothetical protein